MRYSRLGHSGLKISRIGLGCMSFGVTARDWRIDEDASRAIIRHALDRGITFFDTADLYGAGESETVLGGVLGDFARRDEVVIATKLFYPVRPDPNGRGLSRKAVFASIDASLKRLGTDHVDLYQIHRWDEQTPIEETMEALNDVVRSGRARYIGASSMFAWQLVKANAVAAAGHLSRFISVQPHYNLLNREEEREMLPMCRSEGIGVIPWSPLARGRLARPWSAGSSSGRAVHDRTAEMLYGNSEAADRQVVDALTELAATRALPQARIALAWLLSKSEITAPIVGVSKVAHLDEAIAALDITLDAGEIAVLETPYLPHAASFFREVPGLDQDR